MLHLDSPGRWRTRFILGLGALILTPLTLVAQIQADEVAAVNPYAPAMAPRPHDWLLYVAMGLSLLNLVLVYMLYRSPGRSPQNADPTVESGHGARTEKRIEKRKREIDELRQQIDDLSHRVVAESNSHLNVQQIQELVRTLVKDELNRQGTTNSSVR